MTSVEAEYQARLSGPWTDIRDHLPRLYRMTAVKPGAVVIELGVRTGESTRAFLAAATKADGQVWSCDIAPPRVSAAVTENPRWHFIQADDLSQEAQDFLPGECDVLFNDAHDDFWPHDVMQKHVLDSLELYVPRVRPGGAVLLHDTEWSPPATQLGKPEGPVAKALDQFCAAHGLSWRNLPGFSGLGCIRVKA